MGLGKGDLCPGLIWALLWLIILLIVAWPIAFLLAWIYVLLVPFGACIDAFKSLGDSLLKFVQLPLTCAQNMVNMKPLCK